MNRSTPLLGIAVALAGFGVHRALYIPGMLAGPSAPLLLIGFALQAVLGIVAGVGVWRGAAWAPLSIVLLGVSFAATVLVQAFVFGIVAWLYALLAAALAILLGVLVARYVRGGTRAAAL